MVSEGVTHDIVVGNSVRGSVTELLKLRKRGFGPTQEFAGYLARTRQGEERHFEYLEDAYDWVAERTSRRK